MRSALAVVIALLANAVITGQAGAKTACTRGKWTLCYSDAGGPVGYDHPILGTTPEWQEITISLPKARLRFPQGFIEDTLPRIENLDGRPVALVVHTDLRLGARLVILSLPDLNIIAATPHIGAKHRWLAPIGIGDFDGILGDEIAYVDRPHLAQELVFLRLENGQLMEASRQSDLTNHRIGDAVISGGIRNCGAGDEVILFSTDWSQIMAARSGSPAVLVGPNTPKTCALPYAATRT